MSDLDELRERIAQAISDSDGDAPWSQQTWDDQALYLANADAVLALLEPVDHLVPEDTPSGCDHPAHRWCPSPTRPSTSVPLYRIKEQT